LLLYGFCNIFRNIVVSKGLSGFSPEGAERKLQFQNTLPMGKAIVKCSIANYAEDNYVVEVPCDKDDLDEIIIDRAWKKLKEDEQALPYGNRSAVILKRVD
jgi:hypothetical protein